MEKKLYVVTVKFKSYVWAESHREAIDFHREIARNEEPSVNCESVPTKSNPLEWHSDFLVYSNEVEDVSLYDAWNCSGWIEPWERC